MKLFGSMKVIDNELTIGGIKCTDLAEQYGTPLYVYDEDLIRDTCRRYMKAFTAEGEIIGSLCRKAFLTMAMCNIVKEEGLHLNVVSGESSIQHIKAVFLWKRCITTAIIKLLKKLIWE